MFCPPLGVAMSEDRFLRIVITGVNFRRIERCYVRSDVYCKVGDPNLLKYKLGWFSDGGSSYQGT